MHLYVYDRFDLEGNYVDMGLGKEYKEFDSVMIFLCANGNIEEYGGYKWKNHADGSYKGKKN